MAAGLVVVVVLLLGSFATILPVPGDFSALRSALRVLRSAGAADPCGKAARSLGWREGAFPEWGASSRSGMEVSGPGAGFLLETGASGCYGAGRNTAAADGFI